MYVDVIVGAEKSAQPFLTKNVRKPLGSGVQDIPAKFLGYPGQTICFLGGLEGENELFDPTASCGRPPPHQTVSGFNKLIF